MQRVKRSAGRSIVACAAYRAGEKLRDELYGETHDYSPRRGVYKSFIFTPDLAPETLRKRETLWNAVEAVEKRKDALLGLEINAALAHELSKAGHEWVVREFARRAFTSKGVIADAAIHKPDREGDERNWHVHYLITTRETTAEGFGKKNRDIDRKHTLHEWRELWAEITNERLREEGLETCIDHRSFKDRGIDKEPSVHLGSAASGIERRGEQSDRGDINRAVIEVNEIKQAIKTIENALEDLVLNTDRAVDAALYPTIAPSFNEAADPEAARRREEEEKPDSLAIPHPFASLETYERERKRKAKISLSEQFGEATRELTEEEKLWRRFEEAKQQLEQEQQQQKRRREMDRGFG